MILKVELKYVRREPSPSLSNMTLFINYLGIKCPDWLGANPKSEACESGDILTLLFKTKEGGLAAALFV